MAHNWISEFRRVSENKKRLLSFNIIIIYLTANGLSPGGVVIMRVRKYEIRI